MNTTAVFFVLSFLAFAATPASAQAPGVPVYPEGAGSRAMAQVSKNARLLRDRGELLTAEKVKEQMKRASCELTLPQPTTQPLQPREIWQRARASHLRIGWFYLCDECDKWHLSLSGGYAITTNTAATCTHVIEPPDEMKEGYLVAADDDDNVFAITDVLAASRALDTAILRLKTENLTPVPFSSDVYPGDTVYCFSDPMDRRGYFSQGVVNRFVRRPFLRKKEMEAEDKAAGGTPKTTGSTTPRRAIQSALTTPTWLQVNTDWAPGSSGSAVLDVCGNVVGHVSEIESVLEDPSPNAKRAARMSRGTMIVFHDAIAASNVLSLIKQPPPEKAPPPK